MWWKFCAENKRKNEGKKQTETTQFQEDSMICKLLGGPILVFIFCMSIGILRNLQQHFRIYTKHYIWWNLDEQASDD